MYNHNERIFHFKVWCHIFYLNIKTPTYILNKYDWVIRTKSLKCLLLVIVITNAMIYTPLEIIPIEAI